MFSLRQDRRATKRTSEWVTIRNAITTARQLARFRDKPLGYAHLDQDIRIANQFEEYIEKTHGHKDADYARPTDMRLE
jgi:hypothetical protein